MTEKELKKLNRYQLLELLILQTERVNELQTQLEAAEAKLNARDVQISRLGSIAEASLQLGGVFEAAQNAADLYINAAKQQADSILEEANRKAQEILLAAEKPAAASTEA